MFKLSKEIKDGMKNYKQSLDELLQNKIPQVRFKGVRVPWGIYSHRGGGIYMTRIRIPAGIVSGEQLIALAQASQKFGSGKLHITTRQDIQIHNVKIEDTIKLMEFLSDFDLSSRGGGGNTVRNIMSCAKAGVCPDEVMDTRKYAVALTEYLIQDEKSFQMPRKFKLTFSGCAKDCGGVITNDMGFLAEKGGFRVYVGGGMGARSILGKLLEEHIKPEDLPYCAEAVRNVFLKHGDPKNRHYNRLRFLIEKIGYPEFQKLYREEFKDLKAQKKIVLRDIVAPKYEEINDSIAQNDDANYKEFLKYNVFPQKQKGYSIVELRINRGDLSAQELENLGSLSKEFPNIDFRATQKQNLLICFVRNGGLFKLYTKINGILKDFLYPETLLDIVACKGALTCNLGVCNSPGLSESLEEMIKKEFVGSYAFKKLEVRINGCPNSCGQVPLGKIAFYGLVKRVGNRPVPFYNLLVGGHKAASNTKFGEEIGLIPGRNVPAFLRALFKKMEVALSADINVDEYLEKTGKGLARELLKDYIAVPSYEENKDFYVDWGKTEEFSLTGISQGECGAGVLDIIESDLKDAKEFLEKATLKDLYKALIYSARALLMTKGVDTIVESEIMAQFKEKFVEMGIVAYKFKNIIEFAFSILKEEVSQTDAKAYVQELFDEVSAAYKAMDPTFHFPIRHELKKEAEDKKTEEKKVASHEVLMDLRGVACPINYVKVKIRLETMEKGDKILVYLDQGEPIINVPASLKNDGQDVISITEKDNYFEVLVKKEV
ncbi:sulfurtransferase TusA family protein [Candidatus Saganbacteria bacterium]|nr:sulfurtransferase TusA family protein [Candidatus Saganbacteria bacterium]